MSKSEECALRTYDGYDMFECTSDSADTPWITCSGLTFTPAMDGIHHIIVDGNSCAGETATYQVGIDGATDPDLTLFANDIESEELKFIQHTVTGTATVVLESKGTSTEE